ncbi:uncharacterized protein Z518_11301 [Rhinocladiella mackenziei CBS 650.93]|uniref:Xaa-Pro dipeptidyl-peptidase C-terminal domain-containing protein n=1 Tax=Rhinocladiella mackenziei CBS 650.93 TaxID=1442369 RepID=A0A0D2GMI5_9EURO|nr:uncharacterized protein Z518_11301 [Rhinocladiella mackenziei CBS 650.93]KIW99562.1 hypothetical protein Z518_11301 [Rhinocladiella mackenziei CBS 650.93]
MAMSIAGIEVLQCSPTSPSAPDSNYSGLFPSTSVVNKGFRKSADRAAFQADTIFDRDIEIPLRDGVKLRADIFRPRQDEKVPAIIAWSPYGKTGTGFFSLDLTPGRAGVPKSRTSGFEKFEAPDPAEWTAKGYAICNVDARGVFDSEGDIRWFGTSEGKDGYDTVEHIALLPWCNGNVGMVGNSWLGISQWFTAAENPPHLKCIAPLEGASDIYREIAVRGGVPALPFQGLVQTKLYGRQQQEDGVTMTLKYPTWNGFWEDKRVKMEKINVPAYILASYSTGLHTEGSFRGYEETKGPRWLRVHSTQEWYDLYSKECNDDLQLFFDRYLKDIRNKWEDTPRVRVSILRFNKPAIENHKFPEWPIPNTQYQTLWLRPSGELVEPNIADSSVGICTYQSDVPAMQKGSDPEEIQFKCKFKQPCYVVGYPKAKLYVSCPNHDDLDIFVQLRKMDISGNLLENLNIHPTALGIPADKVPNVNVLKYLGPTGIIRASHRQLDPKLSKAHHPVLSHKTLQKVGPGEVVELQIAIWPCGIAFDAGESLILKISGHDMRLAEFPPLYGSFKSGNKGSHRIYCGEGGYQSELVIPTVNL